MLVSTESCTLLIPEKAEIAGFQKSAPMLPFASTLINYISYFSAAAPPPLRISKTVQAPGGKHNHFYFTKMEAGAQCKNQWFPQKTLRKIPFLFSFPQPIPLFELQPWKPDESSWQSGTTLWYTRNA